MSSQLFRITYTFCKSQPLLCTEKATLFDSAVKARLSGHVEYLCICFTRGRRDVLCMLFLEFSGKRLVYFV